MKKLLARIRMLLRDRKLRRFWTRCVSTVAAIVVFITTYALVLPAITMESEAACGKQAHQHTDSCYEKQLICQLQESDSHHHTDACYEKVLVCGMEPHIHSPECYKKDSSAVAATGQTSAGARILETAGAESRLSEDAYDSAAESAGASDAAAADPAGVEPESMDDAVVSENGEDPAGGSGADFAEDASGSSESDFSKDTTDGSGTDFAEGPAGGSETDIAENPGSEPGTEFAEDTAEGAETDFAEEDFAEGSSEEAGADFAEDSSDEAGADFAASSSDEAGADFAVSSSEEAGADFAEDTSDGTDVDNAGAPADDSSAAGAQDPAQDTAADPSQTTPAAQEESAAAGTTDVLPEELANAEESLSDGYVPQLEELCFPALLTEETGFYYYHIGEKDEIPGTSADITEWKKVNDDTQLAPTDLVKAWLSYTIPAGALNETNQIARYRLPANIHLTDDQILAINSSETGLALQADRSTEDGENEYLKYLGAEAIEGTRTPDQDLIEGTQEYISAAVKAENIYENTLDENGNYVAPDGSVAPDQGACIGQDLIFIFSPYTIEKNQITYDKKGKPVTKGEAVRGWFAMDFNMEQVDWVEIDRTEIDREEIDRTEIDRAEEETDLGNSAIEKSAEIVFAAEDEEQGIKEISETLKLVEKSADEPASEPADKEEEKPAEAAEETTGPASEGEEEANAANTSAESEETLPEKKEKDNDRAGALTAEGEGYKITLEYSEDAGIPENAFLAVREITAETDPEAYQSCLETARQQMKASGQTANQKVDDAASRFFDIEILAEKTGKDGETVQEKIEPAAPVNVNIQLTEAPLPAEAVSASGDGSGDGSGSGQPADPTVLHFAEDGVEQLEATVNTPQEQENTDSEDNTASAAEIRFEAESFSIYGVVYTVDLYAKVISASGETYEITVTSGEDAEIPKGAELSVREILSTDEEYAGLCTDAAVEACSNAQEQGIAMPVLSGARLFDIEIRGEDGKIELSAPVQVSIRLVGPAAADHTAVVHFGEGGTEVLNAKTTKVDTLRTQGRVAETAEDTASEGADSESTEPVENAESASEIPEAAENAEAESEAPHTDGTAENKTSVTEVNFETESFSVYSVVNVTDLGNITGSDKKFALVTGIANDPGSTTGYHETWGQDYFTIIVNAHAMSDQYFYDNQNRIDGLQISPVHTYEDGTISYVGGDPVQWQFMSAGNGKYYLSANGKYLQRFNKEGYNHQWGWEARLVDSINDATQLSIEVNSDGTILICDDGGDDQKYYLHNDGNGEWATRVFKFTNQGVNTNSAAYRFRVCEESDRFDSFAARKVSVQDLTVNDRFLIYRKFEDSQGNEQLYALASDGTFVRVYDGGDTVYWRETDKNVYWNYRLEGGYYCVYSTDPTTGNTVYINPMDSQPSRTITTEPSRLTLIGKDNGEYGTALENWDQTAYDYAGLHVALNDQGVPVLSTGTRVAGTSDTFLFAVASTMPGSAAETVQTVDSEALGIHITVFDYGSDEYEYNAGDKLDAMADVVADNRDVANSYNPHQANSLVKPYLENDLPSSKTQGAMSGLFTANGSAVTYSQSGVTNLFLKSYYDENGMFRYRSEDNYAYLGKGGSTSFTVYRQAATPYPDDMSPGHTYYSHGHYMPFNDIDMTQSVPRLMNQYGNAYTNGEIVGELPVDDGRTYENIYGTQGIPNFFTGMKMEADFTQLKDGRLENGDPMVFKFTGDDDMWVYIDGVLVLDIGGIHEPLSGTIDFATGEVINPTGSSLAGKKTLYEIFMAVLNDSSTPQATKDRINAITWKDVDGNGTPDTFADYTNHDFKAFYMERGAGASNLDIQFNLKVLRPGEVVVQKQLPDGVDPRFVNQEYRFQATFKDYTNNDEVKPLFAGQTYGTEQEMTACTGVYYKDRKDEEGNPVPVPVDTDGYFTLKAGEAAVFTMADKKIEYTIKEVEIDTEQKTQQVEINGQVVTVSDGTADAAYARVGDRSQLNYKNHPYLQNLNIVKHLLPVGTRAGAGDVFEFRVYLETTTEVEGETVHQLVPYSYGPYYVTKVVEGATHYFTLTGTNNAPQDKGTTPVVCSTTGRSGSINSIPPEYTVVVPNLAVGTHFYIEERRDNIPAGYVFDHEDLVRDDQYDYDDQTLGSDEDIISRILARDEKDHQAFDHETIGKIKKGKDAKSEVFNRKVTASVQKQWLKMNGQPYTLEEARKLPGSTNAVITAQLWRKKIVEEQGEDPGTPVTVTFMVKTSEENDEYLQVSEPVTVKNGSAIEFSLGARGTSQAQEIHSDPEHTISRSSVSSNPKITYSNGRQKEKWSKYTISGLTENTIVYATFDAEKVGDDFVGLYIASMEEPGSSETPVEEKVADITLNNGNGWLQQVPMEQGYTYFLMNVEETGLESYTHQYTFIGEPTITTDAGGNLIIAVANKYREPINITIQKNWEPKLTSEEETNAYIKVELHRYAKKTKGLLDVVLKDNYGAPIKGAVFKLYKDGVAQEQDYVTDVNGKVSANNLGPGTYYFQQIRTPEGYSMSDSAPRTDNFVVEDDKTAPQVMHCELQNQALETNGVATITLLDNNGDPIQGAKYNLISREGTQETVIREGLVTNTEGKITVSQLSAGTYYFFETEPPEEYKLPDYWQDTDFTVLERPGIVQYFNLSMTNDLKGKGYVEVTLTGPDGQPVSNAMFELYRESEKLAEAATESDGNLTFGDPVRLSPDTYTVRQVTSDADLLPAAAPKEFTILENGNPNQKKELSFTNAYRGRGTATVTLTRKDTGAPISGAQFELYKDGSLVETKGTDSNGQLTFGSPDKLSVGNYSIKQISTEAGLDVVVNSWPFAILENGDPDQTKSWTLQNEENAGNVTIKLWRKGGTGQWNWDQVAVYQNLKPGTTYSFTAMLSQGLYPNNVWSYQDESDHNNYDSLSANQLSSLNSDGWDSSTNSYHFTITPAEDNKLYSYVLVSGWGMTNIESMTMDESSRQAAASAPVRALSRQAVQSQMPGTRKASTVKSSAGMLKADGNSTLTSDSDTATDSTDSGNGSATRDIPATVSPSGPPSDDYIVDSTFMETYTITKADDNWKHVFLNLDRYDQEENPYYYYVVETECVPGTYHLASYSNDNLTDTGTITINNEQNRGGLNITKTVTVNSGAVPANNVTIADGTYTFTITGPSYPGGHEETITVTDGEAESSISLTNLIAGTYTIAETGSTNPNGITLDGEKTITVAPGSTASQNTAAFTNNLETTQLTVNKVWSDGADKHTQDQVTYKIFRVAKVGMLEYDPEEVTGATGFTGILDASNSWTETVTYLPKSGLYTPAGGDPVTAEFRYYVSECEFEGYRSVPETTVSEDGDTYTAIVTNTPYGSFDKYEEIAIEKEWQDSEGNRETSGHEDDTITFRVAQKKYRAIYASGGNTSNVLPVKLNLYDADGTLNALSRTLYVPTGGTLKVTPQSGSNGKVVGTGFEYANGEERGSGYTYQKTIGAERELSLRLKKTGDKWGTTQSSTVWRIQLASGSSDRPFIEEDDLINNLVLSGNPSETNTFEYAMALNTDHDNTVVTPLPGAQGSGSGTGVWSGKVSNLPMFIKDGSNYYFYTYEVTEVKIGTDEVRPTTEAGFNGETSKYLVKWEAAGSDGWKITNRKKPGIDITVKKLAMDDLDDASAETLKGAAFRLEKYQDSTYRAKDMAWTEQEKQDTENTGLFSFEGLTEGYYLLVETQFPAGYVKTDANPRFRVKKERGNLIVVPVDGEGNDLTNETSEVIKISNAAGQSVVSVGNTPGAALPNSGGPGTRFIYLLGIMLAGLAGAGLVMKRKRRNAV